jgi:hypothetical protein
MQGKYLLALLPGAGACNTVLQWHGGKSLSGLRLGSFRSGDRSEYLAAFALSRCPFVTAVPRQEDFGIVDFVCVLAKDESRYVFSESAFYVQVKSNKSPIELTSRAAHWLTHYMDHPLFVCVVDKDTSELAIYSASPIWEAIFWMRKHLHSMKLEERR